MWREFLKRKKLRAARITGAEWSSSLSDASLALACASSALDALTDASQCPIITKDPGLRADVQTYV